MFGDANAREDRMFGHMDGWGMNLMGGGMLIGAAGILLAGILIGVLFARR